MKLFTIIQICMIFISVSASKASEVNCTSNSILLIMNSNSSSKCASLKVEGSYQIKLCENNKGSLSGADGSIRLLFKDQNLWVAKQGVFDFATDTSNIEILRFDAEMSSFTISNIKENKDGTILSKLECSGVVKAQ